MNSRRIYLDHASTTPLDPLVLEAMLPFFNEEFGNPHSQHRCGQKAIRAIDRVRSRFAHMFSVSTDEVIFTSGATESNNLALKGILFNEKPGQKNQLLISSIEHPSVFETAHRLKQMGFGVERIHCGREGVIDLDDLQKKISDHTRLVSIMTVNNEIGTIEPIHAIGKLLAEINADRSKKNLPQIFFHTDASQALAFLPIDFQKLKIDLCSVSSHKIYGPKGIGALIAKRYIRFQKQMDGGPQERQKRAGTLNVPAIAGFGKALDIVTERRRRDSKRIQKLRDDCIAKLELNINDFILLGPRGEQRIANNVNGFVKGLHAAALMISLDLQGFAVSVGTACSSGDVKSSRVLSALHHPLNPKLSLRITLGRSTKDNDIDRFVKTLRKIVAFQKR